jgi:hypothetical protein
MMEDLAHAINTGRPGWLCSHRMCRDICPRCKSTLQDWLEEDDVALPGKTDILESIRIVIAGDGLQVSARHKNTFKLRLVDDDNTDTIQVYEIRVAIPRDKTFFADEAFMAECQQPGEVPAGV